MKKALVFAMLSMFCVLPAHAGTAGSVFQIAARSTVVVFAHGMRGSTSVGTGVVLSDRVIATNCHVIDGAVSLLVRFEQREYPASRGFADPKRDLCMLTVSNVSADPATIGNSGNLTVGTRVYAVGTPHGLELTLSEGIVSGFRQDKTGRYIQTTTPVSPGSSGGGLYDEHGRLVGLMSFTVEKGQNLNFALPVEWIAELLDRHGNQRPSAFRVDITENADGQKVIRITD
ncbi:Trypsin-like peptidase domain-containing protein [Desulfonatronum thiosulfatophilum]|uniref:Trypsin-like peptidase domain-containing protein n=1 Tax=Desulfonatronum thiosulfatophilum TaxID=617002 RepID=A0A1G6CMR9_9BACT|nr:serine protease [Desulfonatronum thiosulfatophilum]SDB34176.1 Trypsin-like peptidase domain-containing protein [Desulfonatronum thiosulfatophilum]